MYNDTEITYYCPYCETEVNLVVCINGPNEYYLADEVCPNCSAQVEGGEADRLASDAVINYYAMQADFANDMERDREMGL